MQGTVTAGPFGGEGGRDWSFCPAGLDTRFTEITITYDTYITSLSFLAKNIKTGQLYKSRVFGGGGGTVQTVIFSYLFFKIREKHHLLTFYNIIKM